MRISGLCLSVILFCGLAPKAGLAQGQNTNRPALSIRRTNNATALLSWTNSAASVFLQQADSLATPILWGGVLQTPAAQNNQLTLSQTISGTGNNARFFRLVGKGIP